MESQDPNLGSHLDRLAQLESENKALQEEITDLHAAHQAAVECLETRRAIEEKYWESHFRFKAIFDQSMFGNKIITPNLEIIQVNHALQST